MKKFKAVIKAETMQGAKLNYTCTKPAGLLHEAIMFAALDGMPIEDVKTIVDMKYAALCD